MAIQRILLFGDETADKVPVIRSLVNLSRNSPPLQRFLQESIDVVQREVLHLSPEKRKFFLAFDDLITLAEENAKAKQPNGIVSVTLNTIARLGELIIHADSDPSILGPPNVTIHILGLCTGLLPAAVAAIANNTGDLHRYGLEMIAFSVRLASGLWSRSQQIEAVPGAWAYSIVGSAPHETQAVLDKFHTAQGIPEHGQAFAGVMSRTWTTVFGPPTVLAKLWKFSPELGLAPRFKLDIDSAVHARHLPSLDMDKIIGNSFVLNTPFPANAQILSTSAGQQYMATDLRSLLYQMTSDIAQNPLLLTETVQTLISNISENGSEVDLIVVGPTIHTRMVQNALQERSIKSNLVTKAETLPPAQDLRGGSRKVAIVGMSGRFPGGEDTDEFWKSLLRGADFHQKIPPSRFDLNENYDPTGDMKNSLITQYGCFLENPGGFDSRLFNVSPREAMQMDPVQRLLLMVSYEALELAGYSPGRTPSTDPNHIATYMAQTTDDWRETIQSTHGVDIYYIPGQVRAFTPGRINHHFKWEGPSHSVDAACSGSSTSVQLACRALLYRECDTALAGGGAINTAPAAFAGCGRGGFLSPTGGCKTFREDADGYCRGDGIGVVVLKRLEDALADNDNVLAVISGSARTYSASAASMTTPHRGSQVKIYRKVLHQAGFDPHDIGYIEMHGTGTQLGDMTEMQSICEVFGENRPEDHPLVVGAVKANVGHGEAAAGVTSLIKCVLMLQRGGPVPPQPSLPFPLNPKFPPLDKCNINISDGSMEFHPRPIGDGKKKLLLNNFDASGGNTCLALEEPPDVPQKRKDPREYHVVVCSARTPRSLEGNKQRLLRFLDLDPDLSISDLAYTTTARRMHDVLRASYVIQTPKDLSRSIRLDLQNAEEVKTQASGDTGSVVFAFSGQESLYPGMGKLLFETCPRFRDNILTYQRICNFLGFPDIVNIIANADMDTKTKTMVQLQLAIVFLELALADLWKSWGIKPDLVIGHSLGEYAAMRIAGVLSLTDTLYLVGRCSMMIENKCSPGFQGFHSAQIEPILKELEASAKGITFAKPIIPVASTLTGNVVTDVGTFTTSYLARQAREPVKFVDALQLCKARNLVNEQTLWIEVGPNPVCLGLIRSTLKIPSKSMLPSIESGDNNWKTISTCAANLYMAKMPILWSEYHRDYTDTLTLLELPTYAFDIKNYWVPFKRQTVSSKAQSIDTKTSPPIKSTRKLLGTTCLQYVEHESFKENEVTVTFSAHTSNPQLFDAIQGHMVDNTAICPLSVFCDMALTAARYTYMNRTSSKTEPHMSIRDMDITRPLVVPGKSQDHMVELIAMMHAGNQWSSVQVMIKSKDGATMYDHGGCNVQFGMKDDWKTKFSRTIPFIKRRIGEMSKLAISGTGYRLQRPFVYKLFATLVDYDDKYQGLDEIYLDSEYVDAAARIKLRSTAGAGDFALSPYWIDPIVHLAGFLLNGDVNLAKDIVFISNGFESFRVLEQLSEDKTYSSYVSIHSGEKKDVIVSDVYVFEGEKLVALCAGLSFSRMTKKILSIIFGLNREPHAVQRKLSQSKPAETQVASRVHVGPAKTSSAQPTVTATRAQPVTDFETSNPSTVEQSTIAPSSQAPSDISSEPDTADVLLNIVASESGFGVTNMQPSTLFSDMGVDSLLSIAIISAVQRQTGVELGASFFDDHPAVADVQREFGNAIKAVRQPTDNAMPAAEFAPELGEDAGDNYMAEIVLDTVASESGFGIEDMKPSVPFTDMGVDSLMSIAIISTVERQTGVVLAATFFEDHPTVADIRLEFAKASRPAKSPSLSEPATKAQAQNLTDSTSVKSFNSSGSSSYVLTGDTSRRNISAFSHEQKPSVDLAKKSYIHVKKTPLAFQPSSPAPVSKANIPSTKPQSQSQSQSQSHPTSNVVLIRGRASSKDTPLFLATDGAGSATAYIHLPALSTGKRIYALESPYLQNPTAYQCSVEELCTTFCTAIRKMQPEGPYIVGGWSAGAAYAYEIVRQLLSQDEQILGLILIDMRVPRPMPDALEPSLQLVESAGLFTGIERVGNSNSPATKRLKQHLVSTITALVKYLPIPLEISKRPAHSFIIWAKKGLSESRGQDEDYLGLEQERDLSRKQAGNVMENPDTGVKSWFYDKREIFGPNGWDKLVGDIECHVLDGADHFSMIMPPKSKELGRILEDAIKKCLETRT